MDNDQIQTFCPYDHLSNDLKIFDKESLLLVERAAAGLTPTEVLALFNVSSDQLTESPADKRIFEAAYARGESLGKLEALTCLLAQMRERQGVPAALTYLKVKAEQWRGVDDDAAGKKAFNFTVMMD
jgi:hypothetical protein